MYRSPHFCFPWGRPWGSHAKYCMDGKRIRQIVSQHVLMYLQQFPSYSNRKCKKSPFSRTAAHIFVSLETPLRLSRNMLQGWKDNSMLAKPLAACTYLSSIVSESMRKSKNRYFYHILVSPGDAPGAITLNIVWMEREFDAYKLSRCMCPSNYRLTVSEIERDICEKSSFYHTPCIRRPRYGGSRRHIGTPFRTKKLEWCRYPMVKKFRRYLYSF